MYWYSLIFSTAVFMWAVVLHEQSSLNSQHPHRSAMYILMSIIIYISLCSLHVYIHTELQRSIITALFVMFNGAISTTHPIMQFHRQHTTIKQITLITHLQPV